MNTNLGLEKEVLEDNVQLIRLSGELDIHSVPEFKQDVLSLLEQGCNDVIIDLDELSFMDSRGLGSFIGILRNVKEKQGSLRLICSNRAILTIFQRTGLNEIFSLYDSLDKAVAG